MKRLVIEVIEEQIRTDEEPPEHKQKQLDRIFSGADTRQRQALDDLLMVLTGWRYETLSKMARGEL